MLEQLINSNAARAPIRTLLSAFASAPVAQPMVQWFAFSKWTGPAPMLFPANTLVPPEEPVNMTKGSMPSPYGNWPIVMREFERNRLRRTDAVAEPLNRTFTGLLV